MMTKTCMFFAFIIALAMVFVSSGNVFAKVSLDASAALGTVPAERTTKIGPNNDGQIPLNGNIEWGAGNPYNATDRLRLTLPHAASGAAEFMGTYAFIYTRNAATAFTVLNNDEGNTLIAPIPAAKAVAQGSSLFVVPQAGTTQIDVSGVTGDPQGIDLGAVLLTSGAGTVDKADTDPIIQTLTQYAASNNGVNASTIDAINHGAQLFSGSTNLSALHTLIVQSTNIFNGTACYAPTLQAGDNLYITLTGPNAYQGVNNMLFYDAGTKFTRAIGAETNAKVFTFSAAQLLALDANAGRDNVNILIGIQAQVAGNTQLQPRTIAANNIAFDLGATGNGTVNYTDYGNVFNWPMNGSIFRANYFRNDASGNNNQWYKFSNTSAAAVPIEVRYHSNDGATVSAWTMYGTNIPQNGVLTISKAQIDALFAEVAVGTIGWLEFRVHTAAANCTGIINGKMNGDFFNIPMHYQSAGDTADTIWR